MPRSDASGDTNPVRRDPEIAQPTCTATVTSIDTVDDERRATLAREVKLADGTLTLTGDAVVAL